MALTLSENQSISLEKTAGSGLTFVSPAVQAVRV